MTFTTTFVTCYFDITFWNSIRNDALLPEPLTRERDYLKLAEPLLQLDIPLAIFIQPRLLPAFQALRPGTVVWASENLHPDLKKQVGKDEASRPTVYYVCHFEDLPLFGSWSTLRQTWARDYEGRGILNAQKDTPAYLVLQNSKWSFIERVAQDNPFASTHTGWIDIGIGHCTPPDALARLQDIANGPIPKRLCLCMPVPTYPPPYPLDEIIRRWSGRILLGIFTLPNSLASLFAEACKNTFRTVVGRGYYPLENELLYWILLRGGKLQNAPAVDARVAELALPAPVIYSGQPDGSMLTNYPAQTSQRDALSTFTLSSIMQSTLTI